MNATKRLWLILLVLLTGCATTFEAFYADCMAKIDNRVECYKMMEQRKAAARASVTVPQRREMTCHNYGSYIHCQED